jgi:DNA-binding NtrC family response regulator
VIDSIHSAARKIRHDETIVPPELRKFFRPGTRTIAAAAPKIRDAEPPAPPEYRLVYLAGRLAAIDEATGRHWDELAPEEQWLTGRLADDTNKFEAMHIRAALERCNYVSFDAAKMLGMSIKQFYDRRRYLGVLKGQPRRRRPRRRPRDGCVVGPRLLEKTG